MYIKSSGLKRIDDKNYLQLFLQKEYPYVTKVNGEEIEVLEMLFEEPSFSDISDLKNLGIAIEKLAAYDSIKSIRIANIFSRESIESLRNQQAEDKESLDAEIAEEKKESTPEENIIFSRFFMSDLLIRSADFQNDETDYFKELEKFIEFLNKKSKKDINGTLLNNPLSVFDKYHATSLFIKEELIVEYVAFFFAHFPSRSLHISLK